MAMKFYSDVTKSFYDSEKDCIAAETAAVEKANQEKARKEREAKALQEKKEQEAQARKEAAAKVKAARETMLAAQREYRKVLEDFCKKYGSYHQTLADTDIPTLFNSLFDFI